MNYHNFVFCKLIRCTLILLILLLFSCTQKKQSSESENIEDAITGETTIDTDNISDNRETNAELLSFFPETYTTILDWETVSIGQDQATISLVQDDTEYIELLKKNVTIGYNYQTFIPDDTIIGSLENLVTKDRGIEQIFSLLSSFFTDIQQGRIDTTIAKHILADEISGISRQVAYSREYGKYITEYRLGKLFTRSQDEKYANVRIIAQFPDFESRVKLIIYFTYVNSTWFISAIEGDINELLNSYTENTRFQPSGTTGISQGF